jgi:hypothetical protein
MNWKEEAMVYFKVLPQGFSRRNEKESTRISLKIASVWPKMS